MAIYDTMTEAERFACRVIADHARATAFAIADGILPGNEGRNYVLRKIMRRAIYHGREHLGLKEPFFYKVCDFVVDLMHEAYPELAAQRGFIQKMVRLEEERFVNTVTVGLAKLNELKIEPSAKDDPQFFSELARLYDTFGTPRDLIRVYLSEKGIEFGEEEFNEKFDAALQQLQKQSGIGKTERKSEISPVYAEAAERFGKSEFRGYETTRVENARVTGIIKKADNDRQEIVNRLDEGEEGLVILTETPFYAESGGQVGDTGIIAGESATARVFDTFAPIPGLILHKSKIEKGSLSAGDEVIAIVDEEVRNATRRNHTATHLVHAALKEVLGSHVKQAGSVVAPGFLRFDFTHFRPLTDAEIAEIEDLVNYHILQNEPVSTDIMALEEAMRSGAVAMFGEKYGSQVRVLRVGDGKFSMELCGGTHVRATGDIGIFKILSDEAIASGVRRIRAITGFESLSRLREDELLIDRSLGVLKTQRDQLPAAIERLQEELKRARREAEELKLKLAMSGGGQSNSNGDETIEIGGVRIIAKIVDNLDANAMRQLSDTLLARLKSGVVILGRNADGKAGLIVRVSPDLTAKIKAGNLIKEMAPILGGRGGGRPDMAEGGGPETDRLQAAIDAGLAAIRGLMEETA